MSDKFTKSGSRGVHTRVKTAKGRKKSSTRWLQRQLNDPYVQQAKRDGYRSRAAYKLLEMDDKLHVLKPGAHIVDLGAAPGGWMQVAAERCKVDSGSGSVIVGIDLIDIEPPAHTRFMQGDFTDDTAPDKLKALMEVDAMDVVLSDMAPNTSGHAQTDHLRIMALCEMAFEFACEVLKPGGGFIAKTLQGGTESALLAQMKQRFTTVKHMKPKASRQDSAEMYVVAVGFKP
ncbi:MAG: RlmE family RNA methyltransferase [Rickettsiales bacterium]